MGSEPDPSSTPKLSLYSLPSKSPPAPGSITPPLYTVASIPFQWEEAPGKPRPVSVSTTATTLPTCNCKSRAARCLELPPRLLLTDQSSTVTSPKTVLEGPYEGGRSSSISHTLSFSLGSGEEKGSGKIRESSKRERWLKFTSWRWGSFKDSRGASVGSFDFSSSSHSGGGFQDVKMTRVRRRSSFLNLSNSSLVTSIYGSLKQAVPWRRRN